NTAWCNYGYNNEITIFNEGFIENRNRQFYAWQNADQLLAFSQSSEMPEKSLPVVKKAEHYAEFLPWLINRMVTQ
ncbi:MAG: LTA synthase family protein, partial [Neisseriaceae bacterium]|nr:LTA synthase family protein [Neisseriaceae bacterium]